MKRFLFISACILLAACSSTTVKDGKQGNFVQGFFEPQNYKINKMIYLSLDSKSQSNPCNINDFYLRYAGKILSNGKESIRIDGFKNVIFSGESHEVTKTKRFWGWSSHKETNNYKCHYEGYGVEYDLSDIPILSGNADEMNARPIPAIKDEM